MITQTLQIKQRHDNMLRGLRGLYSREVSLQPDHFDGQPNLFCFYHLESLRIQGHHYLVFFRANQCKAELSQVFKDHVTREGKIEDGIQFGNTVLLNYDLAQPVR
jgi:hypothetical protein